MLSVPPWTMVCETPRISSMPPSVTMNGCSLSRVISRPWPRPTSSTTASATTMPSQSECPMPPCACDEIFAMMTPVRPTIEPTDRSMPPVTITKPLPIA